MNQNCEVNAAEIKRLEERVSKLEEQRESDTSIDIHNNRIKIRRRI